MVRFFAGLALGAWAVVLILRFGTMSSWDAVAAVAAVSAVSSGFAWRDGRF